jgi:O-antigen biosynthesis protein
MPLTSVIIPTHNTRYLKEAVNSVLDQTDKDLEVLVVPNRGVQLGGALPEDKRIRVVEYDGPPFIGAIKRFAFKAALGEILVELDHDDILAPDAISEIRGALSNGAGFAYSNFAHFREDGQLPQIWDASIGWRYRDVQVRGRKLKEAVSFDPTPAALGRIWYAPNHVRAWKRDLYEKAGGHDSVMDVCDDHDLVTRTYLSGEMARIDKCLYLYREHPENTCYGEKNQRIQILTQKIYSDRIEALVLRHAGKLRLPCFDLGGAHSCPKGWISVDLEGAEVTADLTKRWPWPDGSVAAFRAYDFLEHLPDKMHSMREIHRCLMPGGWILSNTPSAMGQGAHQDPTHVSYWVKNSFLYWTDRNFAKYIRNTTIRFQNQRLVEHFPSQWHKDENVPYITFDGVCLKDGYDGPGPHEI